MYAVGRFSYGQSFPRYKAIVSATAVVAAAAVSLSCSASLKQAGRAEALVNTQIGAEATRKVLPSAGVGINTEIYGNAHAVIHHKASIGFGQSLSAHIFSQHNAEANTVTSVDLFAVAANVLGNAIVGFSASIAANAHKKSFREAPVSFSGALSAASLVVRGGRANVYGPGFVVFADAKARLAGELFWRHSANAHHDFKTAIDVSNSGVILKALGAKVIATNFVITANAHKKAHGYCAIDTAVDVAGTCYGRQWPMANIATGTSVVASATRLRQGAFLINTGASLSGNANQRHQAGAATELASIIEASPGISHGAKAQTGIAVDVAAGAQRNRMAASALSISAQFHGNALVYKYAEASVDVGFSMTAFAYQNIGVDAPVWRTSVLPEEVRNMILPEENREMELI